MRRRAFLLGSAALLASPRRARGAGTARGWWEAVFARMPPALAEVAHDPQFRVQLRCLRPARGERFDWGLQPRRWYSAGSVVKLPMALLMAERLSALGLDARARLEVAPPASGEWPSGEPAAESFAHGLRRTFAVSDNAPFNRWYELLGTDAVHARLAAMGWPHVRLIARLGSADRKANRRTGGGRVREEDGRIVAALPARDGRPRRFPFGAALDGTGWREDDGSMRPGPHDFAHANFLPLADALDMLQAFLVPESVPRWRRWRIAGPLRAQLLHALAARPRDAGEPTWPEATHPDGYARWLFVGDGGRYPPELTVFGKAGMAYGFLTETAWGVDRARGLQFALAASVYANRDGVFNDDRYEYAEVALPFLHALGHAVWDHERELAA